MNKLFEIDEIEKDNTRRCGICIHSEGWSCGSKIFYYCKIRKSKRTFNGLLKVKCKDTACELFKNQTYEVL
jgi:hypothetical protein